MMHEDLDSAMNSLQQGDRSTFSFVFSHLWPLVLKHCQRFLHDPSVAEDVAQAALEKVFFRISTYDPTRPALPWVMAITTWEIRTQLKKKQRERIVFTDLQEQPALGDNPEQQVLVWEYEEILRQWYTQMSPEEQQTFSYALEHEEMYDTQTKPATLRKRKQRLLQKLRAAWRTLHGS